MSKRPAEDAPEHPLLADITAHPSAMNGNGPMIHVPTTAVTPVTTMTVVLVVVAAEDVEDATMTIVAGEGTTTAAMVEDVITIVEDTVVGMAGTMIVAMTVVTVEDGMMIGAIR